MDDEEDPYESLPGGRNTVIYMTAGAAAGILEHCVVYPVDVVRTRMQSISTTASQSFWNNLVQLVKTERFRSFRGISVVITGAGPAHALYFSCYENLKKTILYHEKHTQTQRALAHGIAGCGATLLHDGVMNPVDVIKQRMQMSGSEFKNSLSCAKHILKREGLRAFYKSYFTQLTMNLPYQSLHFVTYELMQDLTNRDRHYDPKAHVISGAVAGAVASAVTTPLDVCKTLLNTQEKLVSGLTNAMKVVYKERGIRGYFQGLQPRVVVAIPSTAVSWFVYEFFKNHYKQS